MPRMWTRKESGHLLRSLPCQKSKQDSPPKSSKKEPNPMSDTPSEIIAPKEFLKEPPKSFLRPCDHGLLTAVMDLETQLGTIEAYNRIVGAAMTILAKIKDGKAVAPNPCYLNDQTGTVGVPKVQWLGDSTK